MKEPAFDVIIVGYGPVAAALAVMLGRQGRRVAIFERWTERYNLPRAVCLDHETYRMLSAIGMGDALPAVTHPTPPYYQWFNEEWKELLRIDWSQESISGGPETHFVHQPTLEAMFDEHVRRQRTVTVNLGWEVLEVSQEEDAAYVVAQDRSSDDKQRVSARYVIGCDGANSIVRRTIGGTPEDRGFEADWLVIDVLPHEAVKLDIPAAAQWCNPQRPTTIVPAGVKNGRYFRRWEFMRLPHETVADIESEDAAWRLLEPWVRRDQATMVRHKVYTFRSLLAKAWRDRRLLIAGDAAHVMPPFMGQGMCAGLRDDWNLAWKLDLVLSGKADPELLNTYQVERAPHVSDIIDLSMYLGRVICQPDPEKAAERDAAFLSGAAPSPPPFPRLTAGLLDTSRSDAKVAGFLSPHGDVSRAGAVGKFDALVGAGRWVLVALQAATLDQLPTASKDVLARIDCALVALAARDEDSRLIEDRQGRYASFIKGKGVLAMLIRPDFYVYGGSHSVKALSEMIERLPAALHLASSNEARRKEIVAPESVP